MIDYKQVENELSAIGRFMVAVFEVEVVRLNKVATGGLRDSARFEVNFTDTGATVDFFAAFYAKFVNDGRKAEYPKTYEDQGFLQALVEWVLVKGKAKGNREAVQAAYFIRKHIFENGIPPVPILDNSIAIIEKEIQPLLQRMFNEVLTTQIDKIWQLRS